MNRNVKPTLLACVISLTLLLVSCASASSPLGRDSTSGSAVAPSPPSPGGAPAGEAGGAASQPASDRLIVRNASLRLVVDRVDDVLEAASGLAEEMGGYVVTSESQDRNGDRVGKTTLRVPAARLGEAVKRLKDMAIRVAYESSTARDVTEEFVDQEARLRTLRATEEQYLQLLRTARATEDILKIQQSLGQIREQIEKTEGRIQYLRRSSDMALISLDVYTTGTARPIEGAGWNALETLYGALRGLVAVVLLLGSIGIWVLVFAPLWVPALLLVRWWRRRRRQTPPMPPSAPVEGMPA